MSIFPLSAEGLSLLLSYIPSLSDDNGFIVFHTIADDMEEG